MGYVVVCFWSVNVVNGWELTSFPLPCIICVTRHVTNHCKHEGPFTYQFVLNYLSSHAYWHMSSGWLSDIWLSVHN